MSISSGYLRLQHSDTRHEHRQAAAQPYSKSLAAPMIAPAFCSNALFTYRSQLTDVSARPDAQPAQQYEQLRENSREKAFNLGFTD